MTPDVKAIPLVLVRPADAADHSRVRFEDRTRFTVFGQLVRGCQTGGPAAGDDHVVGGHDRDCARVIDPRPAVGNQSGA
jgi:hypothetical protein